MRETPVQTRAERRSNAGGSAATERFLPTSYALARYFSLFLAFFLL
jgi:hypothetical protein